jgi:ParB family transcriptional regulator, chromosome partitioning protein
VGGVSGLDYAHIARVVPHPGNIRDELGDLTELANSIRAHGILQPLVVRPHPQRPGCFAIIAGHRRHAAAKLAGLDEVPITIVQGAGTRDVEIMLVENCQRSDLTAVEKAEAMGLLRRRGYTATRIAQATGLAISTISYYLSLLDLDEASRARVASGTVQVGEAIGAIRHARQATRRAAGKPPRQVSVTEEHFSYRHPLADEARLRCDLAGHTGRKYGQDRSRTEGKVACGECWEAVIRADERDSAKATTTARLAGTS